MNRLIKPLLRSFILFLALSITHEAKSIDTQIAPYYVKFVGIAEECGLQLNDLSLRIEMVEELKPKNFIGVCHYYDNLIQINRKFWNKLSVEEKEQLIFHEAGHCTLNKLHDDSGTNIMNTAGFIQKDTYKRYYDYYIRYLFSNCKKPKYQHFIYKEVK